MQRVVVCRAFYAKNIRICLRKNKSNQSYVWIDSIFKAQNICFGSEIAGLLDHSYNKCALVPLKLEESRKTLLFQISSFTWALDKAMISDF